MDERLIFVPTVLADVPEYADIMSPEPVAPIASISSFDEVIDHANPVPFGLAAYVFSIRSACRRETAKR